MVRIELQPLARRETESMLTAGLDGDIDGVAVRHIWRLSPGVPLYVRELALEGIRGKVLVARRGVWVLTGPLPTPASLTELLGVRLDALDAGAPAAPR